MTVDDCDRVSVLVVRLGNTINGVDDVDDGDGVGVGGEVTVVDDEGVCVWVDVGFGEGVRVHVDDGICEGLEDEDGLEVDVDVDVGDGDEVYDGDGVSV